MKEYCLGDLIDIKHGYAFDGEHITPDDNGVVLVTPGNFRIGGGFQEEKCKFFSGDIPKEFVLHGGDYIVTMTDLSKTIDTLGFSAIVPLSNRIYLHNQRIGLITFKSDECDRDYIYYLMQTHTYQRAIANTSTGSTVHHTSPSKIREYRFHAPEKSMQIRAARFLKNIDSLIENNQKQIKLLEEAAQRLYNIRSDNAIPNVTINYGPLHVPITENQIIAIKEVWNMYSQDPMLKKQAEENFMNIWDSYEYLHALKLWWDDIPQSFDITQVGRILAQTNAKRCDPSLPDLL